MLSLGDLLESSDEPHEFKAFIFIDHFHSFLQDKTLLTHAINSGIYRQNIKSPFNNPSRLKP